MLRTLFAVTIGLSLLGAISVAEADDDDDAEITEVVLRVDTNGFADFESTDPSTGLQAFFVSGHICEELDLLGPCTPIGRFLCWGWTAGSLTVPFAAPVSQEFNFFDRGKIQVQGDEDDGPRAVVGGTGDFRNVGGQATGFDFSEFGDPSFNGEFIAFFELTGVDDNDDDNDD